MVRDRRHRGRRRLSRADIRESFLQATRTAVTVFTVPIDAILFGYS